MQFPDLQWCRRWKRWEGQRSEWRNRLWARIGFQECRSRQRMRAAGYSMMAQSNHERTKEEDKSCPAWEELPTWQPTSLVTWALREILGQLAGGPSAGLTLTSPPSPREMQTNKQPGNLHADWEYLNTAPRFVEPESSSARRSTLVQQPRRPTGASPSDRRCVPSSLDGVLRQEDPTGCTGHGRAGPAGRASWRCHRRIFCPHGLGHHCSKGQVVMLLLAGLRSSAA